MDCQYFIQFVLTLTKIHWSLSVLFIQLEHHSQYVTWCVCITEYWVWYRDKSQAEIDEIPEYPDYRSLTLDELLSATHRHGVTHMYIQYDIPPLDEFAPHLKQLQLDYPPASDRSDRSVDRPPHTLIWVCLVYEFWRCQQNIYHAGHLYD